MSKPLTSEDRVHNLDLAVNLASAGRIPPDKVIETAQAFDAHLLRDSATDD